ncbi:MAG TPA: UbiA family prenyltransferase [Gemmataceae bacterium]|nr:UbiA family prenyltransferase [Gemmataceae bacterium]
MNRLQAYAQLVRLPNLPTPLADILLGFLAVGSLVGWGMWPAYLPLLAASACLYCGGMVWNDYFDREEDNRDRPERPIPSGQISPRQAALCGLILMAAGLAFAVLAGVLAGAIVPLAVLALLLTAAIFLYDGWLKRTVIGPAGMGACRFLNVMLGVAPAAALLPTRGVYLGFLVGLYITGVTWLARTEARVSNRTALVAAACLMLLSLLLTLPLPLLPLPEVATPDPSSPLFPYLLVALGFFVGFPVAAAVRTPTPSRVQSAVKRSLMGLILLDAVLATALAGTIGLVLLVLLAPSVYLNRRRWLYAT